VGQRANLILTHSDGKYDLYYNHWCANTLPVHLFWGPEYAEEFIREQSPVDESGWLNDIWAEGGAVIDAPNRRLLFYGGEDILSDIPLRNVFLCLIQQVWGGWELRWAYEGIADIAAYVDYPVERVISESDVDRAELSLAPPPDLEWTDTIGSVRFEDGELLLFPLYGGVEGYLMGGPAMLQSIKRSFGYEHINLEEWTTSFPSSGFHIDLPEKTIDVWHADVYFDLERRLRAVWRDWTVRDHRSQYEKHLKNISEKLIVPLQSRESYITLLSQMLLKEYTDPLSSFLGIVDRLSHGGKEVKVSPSAMSHSHYEIPIEIREKILLKAISEIN